MSDGSKDYKDYKDYSGLHSDYTSVVRGTPRIASKSRIDYRIGLLGSGVQGGANLRAESKGEELLVHLADFFAPDSHTQLSSKV